MVRHFNRITLVVALATLAAVAWWLTDRGTDRNAVRDGKARHEADYFIENFTATTMDTQGRRRHELSAARLVHFPDDDSIELERPHLVQYTPGEPPLHTVADRGYTTSDSKTILMRGNVRVTRGAHGGQPGGEIETGEMRVLLE